MMASVPVVHFAPQPVGPLRHVLAGCCYCEPHLIEAEEIIAYVHEPTPERVADAMDQLRELRRQQENG